MSDVSQGPGWWLASDGKWYPPHTAPQATLPPDAGAAYPGYTQAQPAASPYYEQGGGTAPYYEQSGGTPSAYGQPYGDQHTDQYGAPATAYPSAAPQQQPAPGAPYGTGSGAYPTAAPAGGTDVGIAPQRPMGATHGSAPMTQVGVADAPAPSSTFTASQPLTSVRRPHWQPWLALAGIALVLWGAGQGMLAWAQWHMVQAQFSTFGTVTQGHVGMVLTAAGAVVAGIAVVAIALSLDRR
ncbi:MAG: hypothetical protein M0013_03125 [Actinomycetota bacterium]|nr:hypothetical protein [Actinomycetota bacterium]